MSDPNQPTQPPDNSLPPGTPTYPPPPPVYLPPGTPTYPPPPYSAPPSMPLYSAPPSMPTYPPPPMWSSAPPSVAPGAGGAVRQTWNTIPPALRWILPVVLILLVVGSLGGIVAYQHLTAKPDGYLYTDSTDVVFVQFTEDQNNYLNGTLDEVYENSDQTITTHNAGFTGTQNGSQISLTFSVLGTSTTVTGTLDGNTLTLQVPDQNGYLATDVFHGASVQDYNNAVTLLRQRVSAQVAATQDAQATVTSQQNAAQATASAQSALDQAVTNANSQLSNDLNTLTGDVKNLAGNSDFSSTLTSYANDWAQMQKDYQQEQTDYQGGCANSGAVSYDASSVSYDLSSIQYDDSSLSYDETGFNNALQSVQSDIQAVQIDWQNLQAAVVADTSPQVSAEFTQGEVTAAVSTAQQQVSTSNTALQSAQAQAKKYDQEAAQTNTDAQNLANSMHC